MGNDISVPVDSFAELNGVISVIDRLEIFDAFFHWFDGVRDRLVHQCFSNFRLCWLRWIESGGLNVWIDWA